MGTGTSAQKLGERVMDARQKLQADKKLQAARAEQLKSASPETLDVIVHNISDAFARCSPFSEALLLVAFEANKEEVQRVLSKAVKQVLSAPINKDEYAWFWRYVFPSSVWMQRDREGKFMYEHMLKITKSMNNYQLCRNFACSGEGHQGISVYSPPPCSQMVPNKGGIQLTVSD